MAIPNWSIYGSELIAFLSNMALESSLIFLPLFAKGLGASDLEVGVIGGSYGVAYFGSSLFFGRQSDIRGRLVFIRAGMAVGAISLALQGVVSSPSGLIAVRALVGFCAGATAPALLAYNFEAGGSTGRFASLGSLGWLVGDVTAIFVGNYTALFLLSTALFGLAFVAAMSMKAPELRRHPHPTTLSVGKRNAWVYLPFFLRHTGANMIWAIFPLFLEALGATKSWVAGLTAINTGGQFLAMLFVQRFRESRMFLAGFILSAATFLGYSLATNYLQLIPVQMLLAVAWATLYVGALLVLMKRNAERATAAGILYSTVNISAAVGPFVGGVVAEYMGYKALALVACGFCLAGLAAAKALQPKRE